MHMPYINSRLRHKSYILQISNHLQTKKNHVCSFNPRPGQIQSMLWLYQSIDRMDAVLGTRCIESLQ